VQGAVHGVAGSTSDATWNRLGWRAGEDEKEKWANERRSRAGTGGVQRWRMWAWGALPTTD
jgi:hypothetical protein